MHQTDLPAQNTTKFWAAKRRRSRCVIVESVEARVLMSSYSVAALATFTGANGSSPTPLVADSAGNLYGATVGGGAHDSGSIFEIAAGSGTLTTLASFDSTTTGSNPIGGLTIDSAGNLYGTTNIGGVESNGSIFELAAGSHTITTLASFNGVVGSAPNTQMLLLNGDLYGAAYSGGDSGSGTIYKFDLTSKILSRLASFDYGTNGMEPNSSLVADANGNLYGTAIYNNTGDQGEVFKYDAGTGTLSTLVSFDGTNGKQPKGGLVIDGSGNLFGTTKLAGQWSAGNLYEIPAGSSTATTVATFDGQNIDPFSPTGDITIGPDGNFYGTAETIGASCVYVIDHTTHDVSLAAALDPGTTGDGANGGLVFVNGDIYGTASSGGTHGDGTVFKLTASGSNTPVATHLVFENQPSDGINNAILPTVTVEVEDASGNVVTTDNSTVSLGLAGGTNVALGGTTSVQAVNGRATFTDLSISTPGTYTLMASDGTLVGTFSNSFTIIDAGTGGNTGGTTDVPTQIALVGTPAIFPDSISVTAAIEDAAGNTVTTLSANGTLNLTDPQGHTVSSNVTITNGIVTTNIDLSTLSTDVQYTASIISGGYSFTLPAPILIPGIRASFLSQLLGAASGGKLPPFSVSLLARSTSNAPGIMTSATMQPNASHKGHKVKTPKVKVDLEILSGPANAKLYGSTKAIAKNNTVTFKNIKIKTAGPYVLEAHAEGYADAVSNNFAIAAGPAKKIEFVSQPADIVHGQPFNVEVHVVDRYGNLVTTDNSTITLSASPKKATINGVLSATPVDGLAQFTRLSFDSAGKYALQASDSVHGVGKASTKRFAVS